jgi:hypothetical protein
MTSRKVLAYIVTAALPFRSVIDKMRVKLFLFMTRFFSIPPLTNSNSNSHRYQFSWGNEIQQLCQFINFSFIAKTFAFEGRENE